MRWSGAILAGGWSRRFGRDKALYPYRGQPLLAWVWEGMAEASERFVVANRPYPGYRVCPDLQGGGGALSGLHAALVHARYDWVAVAGCDQPFLSVAYWRFMRDQVAPGIQAVVAGSAEGLEPLGALYHRSLEEEAGRCLELGYLGLRALLRRVSCLVVDRGVLEARFGPHLFLNANRPEDLP
ncbi:molybdenum cofactor guanylyltransferase [Meiothermus sp. QL-1]|uniref:molybdenum cofactor guanylyltransferase n=1 Tax=Meiothermus sp. QL-1 TaxID=2058095 RepID=UPI000E0C8B46|nr:molybdenum cofactor guanylyltransferase [Meiothermus sp. QL-1]RDI96056.1 molybdenum cofactor guanylyltransferase [Meiothermus sp. QL-1]